MAVVRSLPACLVVAAVLATAPSRADEPRFGDRGTLAFGGDLGIGGEQGLDHGYDTRVDLELDPALDVFVARRLSLGVGSTLSYSFARSSPSSSLVSVSPRIGYAVPLGQVFALWPRLSVDLAYGTDQGERITASCRRRCSCRSTRSSCLTSRSASDRR